MARQTHGGGDDMDDSPQQSLQFDILVADGFVLSEFAAVIDCLRIANRVSPQPVFAWRYLSAGGGSVTSSSMATVETEPHDMQPDAEYAIAIGNFDPDCPQLALGRVIAAYAGRQSRVILLAEAASRYIRDYGGPTTDLTTHWENAEFMIERYAGMETGQSLAAEKGSVLTCAGMGATYDIILNVIGKHTTMAIRQRVADVLLHETIRDFQSMQPIAGAQVRLSGDKGVDRCIALMKAHIEEPISVQELAAKLGITVRSMERWFRSVLNTTPGRFYREMRLNRAMNLLLNTSMSVQEIGLACGFCGGFTHVFKSTYGVTPNELRKSRHGRSGDASPAVASDAKNDGFDRSKPSQRWLKAQSELRSGAN